jgi:hypothetical protein
MADTAIIPESGQKATRHARRGSHPLSEFNAKMAADGWLSPDTYGRDFAVAEDFSAVYLFLAVDDFPDMRFQVAYVGMSTKLASRWATHETLRKIRGQHEWVKRLFKPTPRADLRCVERHYIRQFRPAWNIIGRVPGQ